jgi:hypothetical protein
MRYADGNHRVPNVNCNSDGDFKFNLGNFENVWNDDGWNVNANSVENPNEWNDGNQVFSRNCWFSPRLGSGSFCLKTFLPSTELSADLLESFN